MTLRYQNHEAVTYSDLKELYHDAALRFGDKPLFFQKNDRGYQSKSFRQFADDVDALGTALCAKGLSGKTILLVGKSCWEWATAFLAIACVGTVVPVDRQVSAAELARIVQFTGADAVIHALPAQILSKIDRSIQTISFDHLDHLILRGRARIAAQDRRFLDGRIDQDTPCAIFFTSGTTANARGVMLSHRNLCFCVFETSRMVRLTEEDVLLTILPMHYAVQTACGFLWPLSRGCTIVFGEGLRRLSCNLREARPTALIGVPLLLEMLYDKLMANVRSEGAEKKIQKEIQVTNAIPNTDARREAKARLFAPLLKSLGGRLRLFLSVGAHTNPSVLKGWRDLGILAIQGYEMTECASLAAVNRDTCPNDLSAGMASPDAIIDIFNVKDDGIGEIRYRSEGVMLGYYKNPDLTAKVKRDGWLYTGDVGYLDEEGFLYIVGRKSNAILTANGKEVYPEEAEGLLNASPFIRESVVIGRKRGENGRIDIVAVIDPDTNALTKHYGNSVAPSTIDLEMRKAVSTVNATLSAHKRIRSFVISSSPFPKTVSGKIKRTDVARKFR